MAKEKVDHMAKEDEAEEAEPEALEEETERVAKEEAERMAKEADCMAKNDVLKSHGIVLRELLDALAQGKGEGRACGKGYGRAQLTQRRIGGRAPEPKAKRGG